LKGGRHINGKDAVTLQKDTNWEAWWNYLDPHTLVKFAKFFGVWSGDDGFVASEWSGSQFPPDFSSKTMNRAKRQKMHPTYKRLHIKSNALIYNPVMNTFVEKNYDVSGKECGAYAPGLTNQCNTYRFGLECYSGGKLTMYFIKHATGFVYPEVVCENFYGQRYYCSANHVYETFTPIGRVIQVFSTPHMNVITKLMETKLGDSDNVKTAETFAKYILKCGQLLIETHIN
jgi:hypothetical protein